MEKILIEIVTLVAIISILSIFYSNVSSKTILKLHKYKYFKKDFLLTNSEHSFYSAFMASMGDNYYIFPQIHLDALLNHKISGQNWRAAYRHIDEKSVDFVVCDKKSLKPLVAIEIDDSSHSRNDRIQRDLEVERILNEADIPLVRFDNCIHPDQEIIKQRLLEAIHKHTSP